MKPSWAWFAGPYPNRYPGTGFRSGEVLDNAFARGKGREFGRWIDSIRGGVRSNGHNQGDLIEIPCYIIESLLRDEVYVERDLRITSSGSTTTFICDSLRSSGDDYYNYAEFYNATTLVKRYITDFTGSTKTATISSADASMAANDNIYLTNVQADYRIDESTFDAVGNTTNGTRKSWKFGRCINVKSPVRDIIHELLWESHSVMFEAADESTCVPQLKIKALDKITGSPEFGTLASPGFHLLNGRVEAVKWYLTPIEGIYTSFKLFYHFDYGLNDYQKSITVNKGGYSNPSGGSTLTDEHQNLCKFAEDSFLVSKPFEYSSNWIYDDATAEYFLDKKIRWHTEPHLIVSYKVPLSNGVTDYIEFEPGDQGFISYTKGLPAGYEYQGTTAASHKFMIMSKTIKTETNGVPYLILELIDLGI